MLKRIFSILLVAGALFWGREFFWAPPRATPDSSHRYASIEGLSREEGDLWALKWTEEHPDSFIGVIATKAYPHLEKVLHKLEERGEVLYFKPIYLHGEGPYRFIRALYGSLSDHPAHWIDSDKTVARHVRKRFSHAYPTYVLLYRAPSLEKVIEAKRSVREGLALGTTSIHMTDTHHEACLLAELVFDQEMINLMNQ